ncbi:MAG: PQQ-binding-like beta-propeller repeat protein [Natrialbaceae archaeon]|nr:PQQ-binding-like beta-propeller repeat protein [Natrialbaceae archaeon]
MTSCLSTNRRTFLQFSSGLIGTGWGLFQTDEGRRRLSWRTGVAGSAASPTVVDGVVYSGATGGGLFAMDAIAGDVRWENESIPSIKNWTAPAVANGLCYLKTGGTVYAVDKEIGVIEWESTDAGSGQISPTVWKDTCYLGGGDGVYALDAFTGEFLWQNDEMEGPVRSKITIDGDRCFCNAIRTVVCLDSQTGEMLWRTHDGGDGGRNRIPSSPIVYGNALIVGEGGENKAKIHSLDVKTW